MAALRRRVVGRGLVLEPRGQGQRVAHRRVGPLRVVPQGADDHGSRVQSQAERDALRLPLERVGGVQTLTQLKSRQHRPPGIILVRHRRPKQRQEALAGDLEEGAIIALHRVLDQRQDIAHQMVYCFRPQVRRQGGRLGQSPTQHGNLFVFPVQGIGQGRRRLAECFLSRWERL